MYNIFTLPNGLRVIWENIEYVESVSLGIFVKNGSRNETKDNNGISHFLEHMFFKGTEKRTSKEIIESIEEVGGSINAYTGKESTCFHTTSLKKNLELCLEVLSDMFFNTKLDESRVEKEKQVVIDEIVSIEDSPEDNVYDLWNKIAWGNSSLALPIQGTKENISKIDSKDLKKYLEKHYTPKNTVISICGNLNGVEVEKLIEKHFGFWVNDRKNEYYEEAEFLKGSEIFKKNIEQVHMILGIPGIRRNVKDKYPALLLNSVLGGTASSRLFQKIREEHALCYSIFSYIESNENSGSLNIYTSLSKNLVEKALELIKIELVDFSREGISEERLPKIKDMIKASLIIGLESTSNRMVNNGRSLLLNDEILEPKTIMDEIDKITMEDMNRVIDNTISKGIYNAAFVGENIGISNNYFN